MGELLGQGQRRLALLERLVRVPQEPQDMGRKTVASPAGIHHVERGQRLMPLRIVEARAVCELPERCGELPLAEEGRTHYRVSDDLKRRVVQMLREVQELRRKLLGRALLTAIALHLPEPVQHR